MRLLTLIIVVLSWVAIQGQNTSMPVYALPSPPAQLDKSRNYVSTLSYPTANPIVSTEYYDGLGRLEQTVTIATGGSDENIAVANLYDSRNRIVSQSLPMSLDTDEYTITPSNINKDYWTKFIYDDHVSSSLVETQKPGRAWHNNPGVREQLFFVSSPGKFLYTVNGGKNLVLSSSRYSDGELRMIVTTDEDNKVTRRFIDRHDRVVRESRGPEDAQLLTDYVYDAVGNLRYIIPPLAMDELMKMNSGLLDPLSLQLFADYCYIFEYDDRNHLIYKKLPGIDPVYYCYSRNNILVVSQDGNQRLKDEWTFYGYDQLYRPAIEAVLYRPGVTLETMRESWSNQTNVYAFTGKTSGTRYGYRVPSATTLPAECITAVVYYDSYKFLDQFPQHRDSLAYTEVKGMDRRYEATETGEGMIAGGSVTGRAIRVLGDTTMLVSATYYDWNGQPVQEIESNHIGGYTRRFFCRDRDGKPVTIRQDLSTRWDSHTDVYRYTYDHARRPLSLTLQHDGDPARILQKWSYDDLGRLQSTTLGNNVTTVNYQYNIQNSLTSISSLQFSQQLQYDKISPGMTRCLNGNIAGMTWNAPNNNSTLARPLTQIKRGYAFKYDDYNRLANARYINYENSDIIPDISVYNPSRNYTSSYTYDLNGNPLTVSAKGLTDRRIGVGNKETLRFGTVKQMEITRQGNQIATVTDGQSMAADIDRTLATVDNASAAAESDDGEAPDGLFVYDANGNVIHDGYRDVNISYNHLNRPVNIIYDSGTVTGTRSQITVYDASGRRLLSTIRAHNIRVKPDFYCANYIYRDGIPTKMLTPAGFVDLIDKEYFYYIKDYRENISAVVDDAGKCRQVNHYYPYGSLMGESWTDIDNDYRWEGKRLNSFAALNHYDFETRNYDPVVPGFTSPDPLAEIDASNSPYTYCAANPIRNIDPSGLGWVYASYQTESFFFFHKDINSQSDVNEVFGESDVAYIGRNIDLTVEISDNGNILEAKLNDDGSFSVENKDYSYGTEFHGPSLNIGGTGFTSLKNGKEPLGNYFESAYIGPYNPTSKSFDNTPTFYSYSLPPKNKLDYAAYLHDKGYDRHNASGFVDALYNPFLIGEDAKLVYRSFVWGTSQPLAGLAVGFTFSIITLNKCVSLISPISLQYVSLFQLFHK